MKDKQCKQLSRFVKTQLEIVKKHLDEHRFLRHIEDKNEALKSFIEDYGWLIREIYCAEVCEDREECEIADEMKMSGDLLSKRVKSK